MPVHCRSMSWDQGIFIAELNIEHYRTKLTGQLDGGQRQTITTLLAEEEARLFDLKAVAAERELSAFIALLARRAPGLFDDTLPDYPQDVRDGLLATIGQVPVGLGVVNNSGEMVLSNGLMQRFVPGKIPSRDPQSIRRFKTRDGPLSSLLWPGARALRGEPVIPGIAFVFTAEDGRETEVRVAAVPVRDAAGGVAGAIAAVYDMSSLGSSATLQCLEHLVAEETDRHNGGQGARTAP